MKIGATLNYSPLDHAARWFGRFLPKGLYARALIIIIAPVILLQSVVAYVFMERHYELVTRRLSSAVTADIAALIDIYESYPQERDTSTLSRIGPPAAGC
jgi:two-component system osmolarity sensor histidine kinase EnvZ